MSKTSRKLDLIGQKFGKLVPVEEINRGYRCKCDCGEERDVPTVQLILGKVTQCQQCKIKEWDLIGKTIGTLTVVSCIVGKKWRLTWKCQCNCGDKKCKKEVIVETYNLLRDNTRTCKRGRTGNKNKKWTGCGQLSGNHWSSIKYDAKKRDIKFELSIEEAWKKFEKQEGRCGLPGDEVFFGELYKGPREFRTTASLDRINNTKHYFKDNIWWLHTDINNIKNKLSVPELLYWCNLIVNKYHGNDEIIYDKNKRSYNWTGHGLISGIYWNRVVKQAQKRKYFCRNNNRRRLESVFKTKWKVRNNRASNINVSR